MDNREVFGVDKPIIGMVHLPALPGSPLSDDDMREIHKNARRDARALEAGGIDAIMVENIGDVPFYDDDVPKHIVAAMTAIVSDLQKEVDIPIGVNVLRNDTKAAIAIAKATGLKFTRVDIHTGVRITDQGIVQGNAQEATRLRKYLGSEVNFLADISVKHSTPLKEQKFVPETFAHGYERGLADAIVVTSERTGKSVNLERIESLMNKDEHEITDAPVFVGSGVSSENIRDLFSLVDGVIVGSAIKENRETLNPVDQEAVSDLVNKVRN